MRNVIIYFLFLFIPSAVYCQDGMNVQASGKVVIGDLNQIDTLGDYSLYVENGILTEKVKVALKNTSDWSDDAWGKKPSLLEVQSMIDSVSHLPAMPSAEFLSQNGYEIAEMDAKLLAQIEWLWLYILEQEKKNTLLLDRLAALEKVVVIKND